MSDPVITLDNVSKTYRVYRHPLYQFAGLMNPAWPPRSSYEENRALRDVTLSVPKGQKLGLIGRNGSGKSTLLKIIASRIRPTSGRVAVAGKVSELIELGTGFHPEFTGRENVFSALAYMGITGRRAEELFKSAVEFSELEAFVEQPVRVYSTGMYMRLAFSVAVCVRPELLLVDEVLSVGDAHFSQKCLDKMKELASEEHTTVLFVSHSIHSLSFLCDSIAWIDGGVIKDLGRPVDILNRYDLSIREEEEKRLGRKNQGASGELLGSGLVRVVRTAFEDRGGNERHVYARGDALHIRMDYESPDYARCPDPYFNVGISRADGIIVTCSLFQVHLEGNRGTIKLSFPKLLLNNGRYFVTILVYRHLDLRGGNRFYTVDENVCDVHTRRYEFRVEGSWGVETTVFGHPFEVTHDGVRAPQILNQTA